MRRSISRLSGRSPHTVLQGKRLMHSGFWAYAHTSTGGRACGSSAAFLFLLKACRRTIRPALTPAAKIGARFVSEGAAGRGDVVQGPSSSPRHTVIHRRQRRTAWWKVWRRPSVLGSPGSRPESVRRSGMAEGTTTRLIARSPHVIYGRSPLGLECSQAERRRK